MHESKPESRIQSGRILDELAATRSLAHNSRTTAEPVLAAFDVATGAVWGNAALARAIEQFRKFGRRLGDEDVETLVHEFARVLDYEDILRDSASPQERVSLMTRSLAREVSRNTVETYANHVMMRERLAEECVQRVHMEILSNFDRTHRGAGLSGSVISDSAEDRAAEWMSRLNGEYRRKAYREYDRLAHAQTAGDLNENPGSLIWSDPGLEQVFVRSIAGMFPVELSPSLGQLVDKMDKYEVSLFVPVIREGAAGH